MIRPRAQWFSAAALLLGACCMAAFSHLEQPRNVLPFLVAAGVMSVGFLLALLRPAVSRSWFWVIALGARLCMIWASPGTDIYRYLWEGIIQNHGFSPYCLPPAAPVLIPLRNALWPMIKFPDVTALYPPLAELAFRLLALWPAIGIAALKVVVVGADILVCACLARRFSCPKAIVYAWNPLVIYSFAGGAHYDSWFVLALTGAWLSWEFAEPACKARLNSTALLGAATALKWVCFPMLGWSLWRILRRDGWRKAAVASAAALVPAVLSWAIVAHGNWNCSLYPKAFSADAKSAELLPAIVGPFLSVEHAEKHNEIYLAVFLMLSVFVILKGRRFALTLQSILILAVVTTPMFHAWYATWLIPFAVTTRSRGVIAFSISSFTYFWLHFTAGQPGGIWKQSILEKVVLWAPLLAGLLWDLRNRKEAEPTLD